MQKCSKVLIAPARLFAQEYPIRIAVPLPSSFLLLRKLRKTFFSNLQKINLHSSPAYAGLVFIYLPKQHWPPNPRKALQPCHDHIILGGRTMHHEQVSICVRSGNDTYMPQVGIKYQVTSLRFAPAYLFAPAILVRRPMPDHIGIIWVPCCINKRPCHKTGTIQPKGARCACHAAPCRRYFFGRSPTAAPANRPDLPPQK